MEKCSRVRIDEKTSNESLRKEQLEVLSMQMDILDKEIDILVERREVLRATLAALAIKPLDGE
jgi:hypothetical protein